MGKRLTYEYVKNKVLVLAPKFELISTEYKNNRTKLEFKCPKNHIFYMSWDCFSHGHRCPECLKLNIDFVSKQVPIITIGYKLLSTEYINNHTKLEFLCDKGHKFYMVWNHFKDGHKCPECKRLSKLYNFKYIKEQVSILEPNYELLSTEYIGAMKKLKFKCDKGHIYKTTWASFHHGNRCPECYYESLRKNYTPEQLTRMYGYKRAVMQLSNKNYRKYKKIINPNNKKRGRYKYHLDHIFPVIEGFRKNIPVKYLANPYNLQMLSERKNLIKHDDPWQSEKKLYQGYAKFKLMEENEWD